jgi:hypothetical protein
MNCMHSQMQNRILLLTSTTWQRAGCLPHKCPWMHAAQRPDALVGNVWRHHSVLSKASNKYYMVSRSCHSHSGASPRLRVNGYDNQLAEDQRMSRRDSLVSGVYSTVWERLWMLSRARGLSFMKTKW